MASFGPRQLMTAVVTAVRQSLRTDPTDLEYLWRDPHIRAITHRTIPGGAAGFLRSVALIGWLFARDLWRQATYQSPRRLPDRPIVFFLITRAHLEATLPLVRRLPRAWLTCANVNGRRPLNQGEFDAEFPLWMAQLASLPFLPVVLFRWMTSDGWRLDAYTRLFSVYWTSYGFPVAAVLWLWRKRASAVVVAVDHTTYATLIVRAARSLRIPTIYVQHACVTERFPPLACDVSLLDGEDSLRKYARAGPSATTAYLVGSVKLDAGINDRNTSRQVKVIGIATNLRDPLERVEELCRQLIADSPHLQVVLRARPSREDEHKWESLARRLSLLESTYRTEFAGSFLRRIDALIAGDSSILLEAAVLDVAPMYYDFSEQNHDWYGFVERGLAPFASDVITASSMVVDWQREKPTVRHKARYYCATIDTQYDGEASTLASDLIQSAADGVPPGEIWRASLTVQAPFAVFRFDESVEDSRAATA